MLYKKDGWPGWIRTIGMSESKSDALPLGYKAIRMVGGHGFEPWNPKEQIYSLPRLTTSLTLHKKMVPTPGLEPGTYWLQVSCSTNWAMSAWWAIQDSNLWPPACKAGALTNWANRPTIIKLKWCPRPDLNRHEGWISQDFKSCASTNSATQATMVTCMRFELTHVRVKVWCLTTWLRGKT